MEVAGAAGVPTLTQLDPSSTRNFNVARRENGLAIVRGISAIRALARRVDAAVHELKVGDKIEVDSRSPEQMKIARGSGVCQFGQFNFRMDAESFAKKNFGGPGGKCACK